MKQKQTTCNISWHDSTSVMHKHLKPSHAELLKVHSVDRVANVKVRTQQVRQRANYLTLPVLHCKRKEILILFKNLATYLVSGVQVSSKVYKKTYFWIKYLYLLSFFAVKLNLTVNNWKQATEYCTIHNLISWLIVSIIYRWIDYQNYQSFAPKVHLKLYYGATVVLKILPLL